MNCYVLTVSDTFPKHHSRAGDKTNFANSIKVSLKIHTIRQNYIYWLNRINKCREGAAYISVRYWSQKPYKSKQIELFQIKNPGIEKIIRTRRGWFVDKYHIPSEMLAKNDGLSTEDFLTWFTGYPSDQEMAIIHFTDFRYKNFFIKQNKRLINENNPSRYSESQLFCNNSAIQ